jgi:hypothetical protein
MPGPSLLLSFSALEKSQRELFQVSSFQFPVVSRGLSGLQTEN